MASKSKIVLAALVGATVGGAAIHGLHAQAKPKAYIVTESEIIDAAAAAAYGPQPGSTKSCGWQELPHDWKDNCGRRHAPPARRPQRVGQYGAGAGMEHFPSAEGP